jgi:hypothetical protein
MLRRFNELVVQGQENRVNLSEVILELPKSPP